MSETDSPIQRLKQLIPKLIIGVFVLLFAAWMLKLIKIETAVFWSLVLGISWIIKELRQKDDVRQNRKAIILILTIIVSILMVVGLILGLIRFETVVILMAVFGIGWIIMNMSKRDSSVSGPKPKTSELAITSAIIPLVPLVGWSFFMLGVKNNIFSTSSSFVFWIPFFSMIFSLLLPLAPILAIIALIKISMSKGLLKGYILSILGILTTFLAFFQMCEALVSSREEAGIYHCGNAYMQEIHKGMQLYSNDNDNQYPTADKWCDLLMEGNYVKEKDQFKCVANIEEPSSFAINPNAEPNSPDDMVLLFETKGGWNKSGGLELLATDNHYRKGCNILFNDGHVEFVKPKDFGKLKWKVEESE